MATLPLDIDSLLKEVSGAKKDELAALPEGTKIGHIHLKVTNLQRSLPFYRTTLGFDLMRYYGSAAFLSVGGYHHHIGMNTWESLGGPARKKEWVGLEFVTLKVPEKEMSILASKLSGTPFLRGQSGDQLFVTDPDDIEFIIRASGTLKS